jgi:L-histidine N-alpha-methyltransferase
MTTTALPVISTQIDQERVASAVWEGLTAQAKRLPPWLFYDEAGSRLFDEITERPEYYLTRTERAIFAAHADRMIARAAEALQGEPGLNDAGGRESISLRVTELGAGSADKTRLLLAAAVARQGAVVYEPVDVSATALEAARERIEREFESVTVSPRVANYTHGLGLEPVGAGERRLVLYIGSSIGNFEPWEAAELLERLSAELNPGDGVILGVDLVKDEAMLLSAYDDFAGITAAFNLNLLSRMNRELGAGFDLEAFAHKAVWNEAASRIEMHLESRAAHTVSLGALGIEVEFSEGERIHTENSYKYRPGQAEALLEASGFSPVETWMDGQGWFAVCFARKAPPAVR